MVADVDSDSESITEQEAVQILEKAAEESRLRKEAAAKAVPDTGAAAAVDVAGLLS
jgi:hypothetical protein